jgi:alkylation response protein AidB-like acyl-CoA dehydrogenase
MTAVVDTPILEAVERVAPIVREYADASEQERKLADPIVAAMKREGMFRGLAPRSLGGREVDPVTWFKTVEAAARVDGSFGWCTFINGATGLTGSGLGEALSEQLLPDPDFVVAGAVFPFGKAEARPGGYLVNGRWTYASGIRMASHVFGFAMVFDGETPRMMMPGAPAISMMMTPTSDVEILPTWDVNGLSGTGSNDFVVKDLFVPESFAMPLMGARANRHYQSANYKLPFMTLFALPMGAVALGIAQHAIEEMLRLAQTKTPAALAANAPTLKERPVFHLQMAEAIAEVSSARAWLHNQVAEQYEIAKAGGLCDLQQRVNTALAASNATRSASRAVEQMYLAGGGTANFHHSPLQRCLRDVHAVTQHAGTSPATWYGLGATAAGMPPDNPLLLL